jgi:hypothetical protein
MGHSEIIKNSSANFGQPSFAAVAVRTELVMGPLITIEMRKESSLHKEQVIMSCRGNELIRPRKSTSFNPEQ